jgi:hypothetical protein
MRRGPVPNLGPRRSLFIAVSAKQVLAQNGAKINETTKISVTGCGKTATLTRAQKLAKALKACHKQDKKNKSKRQRCEKAARKKYAPTKKSRKGRK